MVPVATDTDKNGASPKDADPTVGIWISLAVFLAILGGATAMFGLPGLAAVMVVAALGVIALLMKIITEGM